MRPLAWIAPALLLACGSNSGTPNAGGSDGGGGGGGEGGGGPVLSQPEQGIATYYAATGDGDCSFGPSPNDLMVAAMDAAEYDNSEVCGECVQITGPMATITVTIVDLCPGCGQGHLDLSQEAFAMIADPSAGQVPITWEVVACDVTGSIEYRFKEGSSQYWTAIQVRNIRLPVTNFEWLDDGTWSVVQRQSYNYFVDSAGVGTTGAFQVRVTALGGEQLTDTLAGVMPGVIVNGAAQF
jgi:expansin